MGYPRGPRLSHISYLVFGWFPLAFLPVETNQKFFMQFELRSEVASTVFDPYFDFQAEAGGRDADRWSPTLQLYHRALWSKPLPSGNALHLELASQNRLLLRAEGREFFVSSDRAIATWRKKPALLALLDPAAREIHAKFVRHSDTMGGIVIWPSQRIANKITINGHRGFSSRIADRLDLTLECVRRHYENQLSPLTETFKRYDFFFDLFENFRGYVDFFGFQDWVLSNYDEVIMTMPFDDFQTSGYPKSASDFISYINRTSALITARNDRLLKGWQQLNASAT